MKRQGLRWYHGLIALALFAAVMALEYFGLLGRGILVSVIGEVFFALIAIVVAVVSRAPLSEVFPFKKIRWIQIAGIYLMWRGVLAAELFISELFLYFFPEHIEDQAGLDLWMSKVPFALALLVVAIMPAICEELLFRGALLTSMKELKKPWLIVGLNGLIFAVAHLETIKLASVTLFGILLAYIVYRSGNLAYSMILHFLNNGWVVITTYMLLGVSRTAGERAGGAAKMGHIPLGVLGITLCAAAITPLLLYIGNNLFMRPANNAQLPPGERVTLKKQWLWLTGAVAVLICAIGMLLFAQGFDELVQIGFDNL